MLAILLGSIVVIPAGTRGIVFNQMTGIENRVLGEGVNLVEPFLESVTEMDVHVARTDAKAAASSSDQQNVTVDVVVNYYPNPAKVNKVYQKYGDKDVFENTIKKPATQEVVKIDAPKFSAPDMLHRRQLLKEEIKKDLFNRSARADLIIYDVAIANIAFENDYTLAIEDKAKQLQIAEKEELIVRQKQAQAQQQIASAEGTKQAAILEAQDKAEANRLLQASVSPEIIQLRFLDKWNGQYPTYLGAGNMLLQVPGATK